MADQDLMKQGLAGLFKPQDAFEKEPSYGKTLFEFPGWRLPQVKLSKSEEGGVWCLRPLILTTS
jgi:hypothetical protein